MNRKEKSAAWNFIFFIIFSFYSIGAGFVESLANYPVWHIIGPSDVWVNYHVLLGSKIIVVLAIPALLLQLVTNILLVIFRPASVPKWTVLLTLLLLLIAIISSAFIQIPIQVKLDSGYNQTMVDRLINTDLILRVSTGVVRGVVIVYMMKLYLFSTYKYSKTIN